MKPLADLVAARKPKKGTAPHALAASVDAIMECLKAEKVQRPYPYWLGLVKRSGLSDGDVMAILKKAKDLPAKYNRGGYVTNQLRAARAGRPLTPSSKAPSPARR